MLRFYNVVFVIMFACFIICESKSSGLRGGGHSRGGGNSRSSSHSRSSNRPTSSSSRNTHSSHSRHFHHPKISTSKRSSKSNHHHSSHSRSGNSYHSVLPRSSRISTHLRSNPNHSAVNSRGIHPTTNSRSITISGIRFSKQSYLRRNTNRPTVLRSSHLSHSSHSTGKRSSRILNFRKLVGIHTKSTSRNANNQPNFKRRIINSNSSQKQSSKRVQSRKSQHYVYSLNLKEGNKYVGKTNNLAKRLSQHFRGQGAKWTQKHKPISINYIQKCKTKMLQALTETAIYKNMRDIYGKTKVRGAGNTKST